MFFALLFALAATAQSNFYPQQYFRNPLNIKMELVANFGELRTNHWHMGLDIRTQQRENLPVHAAADGYIAAVAIDAMGFGRAIYINHPNGLTTLYAHLNNFEPKLNQWVKQQQYETQSWAIKLQVPPDLFPVKKGDFIAYSGNTGGSQGPHVHFEIRDTETGKCLNPLLFGFPIPDAVPPILQRLALYDRHKNVYAQSPQLIGIKKVGSQYTLAAPGPLKTNSSTISFALGMLDRFSNVPNTVGVYKARLLMDGVLQSQFVLDSIDYNETRYLNAHIDYRYKSAGGSYLQHLSRMPGDRTGIYTTNANNGVIELPDSALHDIVIEATDAAGNTSRLEFKVQYTPSLNKSNYTPAERQLLPGYVNVFEEDGFELFTSEYSVYDTVDIRFSQTASAAAGAASPVYNFLNAHIPTHDSVTVRIRVSDVAPEDRDRLIIRGIAGSRTVVEKAQWKDGWATARFRQFGTFQAFVDKTPPTVNAPGAGAVIDLSRATRLVFSPQDDFKKIKSVTAEVDGQWLLLSNDKGYSYIYQFDQYFTPGPHELKVTVEDMAGNVTTKVWQVRR